MQHVSYHLVIYSSLSIAAITFWKWITCRQCQMCCCSKYLFGCLGVYDAFLVSDRAAGGHLYQRRQIFRAIELTPRCSSQRRGLDCCRLLPHGWCSRSSHLNYQIGQSFTHWWSGQHWIGLSTATQYLSVNLNPVSIVVGSVDLWCKLITICNLAQPGPEVPVCLSFCEAVFASFCHRGLDSGSLSATERPCDQRLWACLDSLYSLSL